jgi:hypothetical protein
MGFHPVEHQLHGLHPVKHQLHAVEESQISLSNERSTWEELLQQTLQEKDRIWKIIGEKEAGRLRAQAQVKELQNVIQLQQIRMQETQHDVEKLQKKHAIDVAMPKKVSQQKIPPLQEQLKENQTTTTKATAHSVSGDESYRSFRTQRRLSLRCCLL